MTKLPEIASLWIGSELTWLEQVCLKSYIDHGHKVYLYSYDPVENVPDGVVMKDAAEILPADKIIRHARTGSPAFHADVFRLRLMKKTPYIWVDTDAYCHQPFKLPRHGHLHGFTHVGERAQINNGVLRLPKSSKTLKAMLDFTADEYPIPPWLPEAEQADMQAAKDRGDGIHVSDQRWGVWGPIALSWFLHETGESKYTLPMDGLYPVHFHDKGKFFRAGKLDYIEEHITENTLSVHLWGRRFRAVAASFGGVPPEGTYAAKIVEKHGIDPYETAHLVVRSRHTGANAKHYDMPDFSVFSDQDVANLCMQRSSVLGSSEIVTAWTNGDDGPLMDFVAKRKMVILEAAYREIHDQYERMLPALDENPPKRVADIGAGYAFVDLMLYRKYDCDIVLIDIEISEERHFGFEGTGAGYSSLAVARDFLIANGVAADRITTINPETEPLSAAGVVDLAFSLISCGFHYPAETYDQFFADQVSPGGEIILDVRHGSRGSRYLKTLGAISVIAKDTKHSMMRVVKAENARHAA